LRTNNGGKKSLNNLLTNLPYIYHIFLDYVMLELATTTNSDSMFRQEMCLLSSNFTKLTAARKQLERACKKWAY